MKLDIELLYKSFGFAYSMIKIRRKFGKIRCYSNSPLFLSHQRRGDDRTRRALDREIGEEHRKGRRERYFRRVT
ncbi:unnamed protein product, partial [Brassica napus]